MMLLFKSPAKAINIRGLQINKTSVEANNKASIKENAKRILKF